MLVRRFADGLGLLRSRAFRCMSYVSYVYMSIGFYVSLKADDLVPYGELPRGKAYRQQAWRAAEAGRAAEAWRGWLAHVETQGEGSLPAMSTASSSSSFGLMSVGEPAAERATTDECKEACKEACKDRSKEVAEHGMGVRSASALSVLEAMAKTAGVAGSSALPLAGGGGMGGGGGTGGGRSGGGGGGGDVKRRSRSANSLALMR